MSEWSQGKTTGIDGDDGKVAGMWGELCLKPCQFKIILNMTWAPKNPKHLGMGGGSNALGCWASGGNPGSMRSRQCVSKEQQKPCTGGHTCGP